MPVWVQFRIFVDDNNAKGRCEVSGFLILQSMSNIKDYKEYDKNPFLEGLEYRQKTKITKIADAKEKLVNEKGEKIANVVYAKETEFDKTPFVKLYHYDLRYINDFTKDGIKLFTYILYNLKYNIDTIILDAKLLVEAGVFSSPKYFYKGLRDVLDAQVVAKTTTSSIYYINPQKIYVGERRFLFLKDEERNNYW